MIAAVAFALQVAPTFVLLPVPEASTVSIQAIVRLPSLNDAERLCAKAAWSALLDGSEEYSYLTIRSYSQQSGRPIQAIAMPDHLLLRVTFPKEQASTAFAILESTLRRPLLDSASLQKSIDRLKSSESDPWQAALLPENWREAKPSRDEVLGVYRKLVRPDNLLIVIGGAFDEGKLSSERKRFDNWMPANTRGYVRPWSSTVSPLLKSPSEVGTLELTSKEFAGTDSSFAVYLLSAAALGVGRGSALTKVAREQNGWSYRQEGFLQPTPNGFRLRMILAHAGAPAVQDLIDPLRQGLAEEIKKWTDADRLRAVAITKSWLENGLGIGPIRLLPEASLNSSQEERTHLAGWWRMKFGEDLATSRITTLLDKVTVEELRTSASKTIEEASVRILVSLR